MLAFTIGPMLASLGISFTNWSLLAPAHWVGADNYRALWSDAEFRSSLGHTLVFIAGYLPLVLISGLAVALALNQRIRIDTRVENVLLPIRDGIMLVRKL